MIKDPTKLQEVRDEWTFAVTTQNSINTTMDYYEKVTGGGKFDDFLNKIHGLVLIFTISVLEKTLKELRDESVFNCTRNELKELMKKSRPAMKWLNFPLVNEGRDRRNKLVHRQKVVRREDTWKYIYAIEKELIEVEGFDWSGRTMDIPTSLRSNHQGHNLYCRSARQWDK